MGFANFSAIGEPFLSQYVLSPHPWSVLYLDPSVAFYKGKPFSPHPSSSPLFLIMTCRVCTDFLFLRFLCDSRWLFYLNLLGPFLFRYSALRGEPGYVCSLSLFPLFFQPLPRSPSPSLPPPSVIFPAKPPPPCWNDYWLGFVNSIFQQYCSSNASTLPSQF